VRSAQKHRRPRKILRTGRHTTPSRVEKAAQQAGKAAPAAAIASVLVVGGQAHAAVKSPEKGAVTVVRQVHTDAVVKRDQQASRSYAVEPGDTLSSIAQRLYGNPADWHELYQENESVIRDPNLIYVGEMLDVPYNMPAGTTTATAVDVQATTTTSSSSTLSGTLSCAGLEELWEQAGGSDAEAVMAASIAMAESSGEQYALSPTDDYGYWQINASHGPAMATFDPLGNAKAAVAISNDGTDWTPWTTYQTGAYEGRC
jgi:LysM repeat protein